MKTFFEPRRRGIKRVRLTRNWRGIQKGLVMTIKEFAFSAQLHLQSHTNCSFKRTHIYEILAASFGFKSYAALSSEFVFILRETNTKSGIYNNSAIRHRCIDLGYLPATAEVASSDLLAFLAQHRIDVVRFSYLVNELRGESSFLDEYEDDQPDEDRDDTFDHVLTEAHEVPITPFLLEGLEDAAGKGIALAHYALALIYEANQSDDEQGVGSSYWHTQAQQGRVLTGVEKEWANGYAKQLADAEKYACHLREAARLGNKYAQLDLAERLDDPSFFERSDGSAIGNPVKVAEIAERLGRWEDAKHWLTIAAESGDIDAMRKLIDKYDHGDLKQCWTWLYLAQILGTDLAKNDYYAINEDEEEYDDDVGGNAYVGGAGGVELAPLSADRDTEARQAADVLAKQISRPS